MTVFWGQGARGLCPLILLSSVDPTTARLHSLQLPCPFVAAVVACLSIYPHSQPFFSGMPQDSQVQTEPFPQTSMSLPQKQKMTLLPLDLGIGFVSCPRVTGISLLNLSDINQDSVGGNQNLPSHCHPPYMSSLQSCPQPLAQSASTVPVRPQISQPTALRDSALPQGFTGDKCVIKYVLRRAIISTFLSGRRGLERG